MDFIEEGEDMMVSIGTERFPIPERRSASMEDMPSHTDMHILERLEFHLIFKSFSSSPLYSRRGQETQKAIKLSKKREDFFRLILGTKRGRKGTWPWPFRYSPPLLRHVLVCHCVKAV